jgi:8-oxo-dGTP pyrophosphatase MutT (NUDIX family)
MTHVPFFIVNVEAAIYKDGRYLIIRRGAEESHAAGKFSLVGGKVEHSDATMEAALRREVLEEVGLQVAPELVYIESTTFATADGDPVVNVVFLCNYIGGRAKIRNRAEVSELHWLTASELRIHRDAPAWTRRSVELAEHIRRMKGW